MRQGAPHRLQFGTRKQDRQVGCSPSVARPRINAIKLSPLENPKKIGSESLKLGAFNSRYRISPDEKNGGLPALFTCESSAKPEMLLYRATSYTPPTTMAVSYLQKTARNLLTLPSSNPGLLPESLVTCSGYQSRHPS